MQTGWPWWAQTLGPGTAAAAAAAVTDATASSYVAAEQSVPVLALGQPVLVLGQPVLGQQLVVGAPVPGTPELVQPALGPGLAETF